MTETAATPQGIPVITADPFSLENLAEPHALHEQLREAGPVVYLDLYGIWGMARYEEVSAALKGWETDATPRATLGSAWASTNVSGNLSPAWRQNSC